MVAGYLHICLCEKESQKEIKPGKIHTSVDFDGVMRSAFMAKDLYDQLKGKCHPDKFATEPEKMKVATEIFALLVKNKHNYDELCKLKDRAIKELNINL